MKILRYPWYILQGMGLAVLCLGAGIFVAGRVGLIEPFSAYVILSGSMSPAIPTGGVVISQKQSSYHVGDTISFAQDKKTVVTHRISEVRESDIYFGDATYITRGDANNSVDTVPVSQGSVQGKVILTLPYLGYAVEFAKSPKGFLALVIIPATIIIYEELRKVRKELGHALGRFFCRFRKPKEETRGIPPQTAVIPIVAAAFILTTTAGAYFLDAEASISNILGAAVSFGEKTTNLFNSDPYTCPDGATNTTEPLFGSVAIKRAGSTVKVDTKLTGALPSTAYDIWVNQDPGGCPLASPTAPGALTSDGSGNGVSHTETAFVPGATRFWVSAVGGSQVLRSIAVTLP